MVSDPFRKIKRLIIGVIGFTILLIGIILIVLPGPAFIVIPAGLAILATEFAWARRLLKKVKQQIKKNNTEAERKEKT
ncbi:MAG: PGPGW domain-containing protein [Nitrospirota bacterium]